MNFNIFKKFFGNQVIKMDQGGAEYSNSFKDYVMGMRTQIFKYSNWPFQDQTQEELEIALFTSPAVAVFSLTKDKSGSKENFFVPVTLSRRITKLNSKNVTVTVHGDFNSKIIDGLKLSSHTYKKELPFIFDNPMQQSPEFLQSQLFKELANTFNANKSNRINKNKQAIIETENGQALETAYRLNYEMDDYGPFTIIEKGKQKGKDNPMANTEIKAFTAGVNDLYNSLSTERKDLEKYIHVFNGIPSSQGANKSSAQETDEQTSNQDRDTANFIKLMTNSRKNSIKKINKYLGTSLSVSWKDSIQKFMERVNIDLLGSDNQQNKEEVK